MCQRSFADPAYPKYPLLPVVACPGYEPARPEAGQKDAARGKKSLGPSKRTLGPGKKRGNADDKLTS